MDNQQPRQIIRYHTFLANCKAKNATQNEQDYYEEHHILPKCIGGTDEPNNLIKLTARQHFIAHWMLTLCYPQNSSIWHALNCMSWNAKTNSRFLNSKEIERARKAGSIAKSIRMKGNKLWEGKKHKPSSTKAIGKANTERKDKFGYYNTFSAEERQRRSEQATYQAVWRRFCKVQRPEAILNMIQVLVHNKQMIVEAPNMGLKLMMIWSELPRDWQLLSK